MVRFSAYRREVTWSVRLVWFCSGILLGVAVATVTGIHAADADGTRFGTVLEAGPTAEGEQADVTPVSPPSVASVSWPWVQLAQCESGGNWHIDAYHDGGLQFLPSTWLAYGGGIYARYAWQATPEQQVEIAQRVQRAAGWGQWPVCSRRLGLR